MPERVRSHVHDCCIGTGRRIPSVEEKGITQASDQRIAARAPIKRVGLGVGLGGEQVSTFAAEQYGLCASAGEQRVIARFTIQLNGLAIAGQAVITGSAMSPELTGATGEHVVTVAQLCADVSCAADGVVAFAGLDLYRTRVAIDGQVVIARPGIEDMQCARCGHTDRVGATCALGQIDVAQTIKQGRTGRVLLQELLGVTADPQVDLVEIGHTLDPDNSRAQDHLGRVAIRRRPDFKCRQVGQTILDPDGKQILAPGEIGDAHDASLAVGHQWRANLAFRPILESEDVVAVAAGQLAAGVVILGDDDAVVPLSAVDGAGVFITMAVLARRVTIQDEVIIALIATGLGTVDVKPVVAGPAMRDAAGPINLVPV